MSTRVILGTTMLAGFVIGNSQGREQYDRMLTRSRALVDDLGLQSAVGALSGRASEKLADARRRFH